MSIVPALYRDAHDVCDFKPAQWIFHPKAHGIDHRPSSATFVTPNVRLKVWPFFRIRVAAMVLVHQNAG
ncbi:hypothetical protein ACTJKS_14995 [Pseudomonas sp. 22189]|uniref:hypothetical protein n=1 Tax=Pseudomonas sp. 22189 TaxID=3453889 RepID=UPI003F85839B